MIKNLFKKQNYQDPVVNPQLPEYEVNKWAISEFVAGHLLPIVGSHPFPLDELMLMTGAVCRFKPEIIFEWGTNVGKSARVFYEAAYSFKIPCHIHSIDLPDDVFHHEHPKKFRGMMVKGIKEVALHQADGLTKALELYRSAKPKGNVLFFVDGDHSYESVKKELTAILEAIPHAVVLLHDTFFQAPESGYNTGPNKAVFDTVSSSTHHIVSTGMGRPGMSLVYKR